MLFIWTYGVSLLLTKSGQEKMSSTLVIELADGQDQKSYDVNLAGPNVQWEIKGATGGYTIDNFIVNRGDSNNYILRPFEVPCSQPCTELWIGSVIFAVLSIFMFVWICSYLKAMKEIEIFDPSKRTPKRATTYYAETIDVDALKKQQDSFDPIRKELLEAGASPEL